MTPPSSPSRPASGRGRRAWGGVLRVVVSVAVVAAVVGTVPLPSTSSLLPGLFSASSVVAGSSVVPGSEGVTSPLGVLGGLLATPAACAAPASDGAIAVAVAVDPGEVTGMVGGPATMCVSVPAGASGADVLAARARALGRPMPRYNSAGLLCAIDGQPATGCGERVDGAYRYWAYFLGTGGWTYAGTGPALRRASAAQLEGWRFVAGAGNATDPPPRTTASPSAVCPPPPPPTTVAPPPAVTSPGSTPAPEGGSGMGGPGSRGDATLGDAGTSTGGAGGDARAAGGADTLAGGEGDVRPGDGGGEATADRGAGIGDAGSGDDGGRSGDEVAGAPVVETTSGGGPPLGALVAAVLVVVLASGAVVRVRRRGES